VTEEEHQKLTSLLEKMCEDRSIDSTPLRQAIEALDKYRDNLRGVLSMCSNGKAHVGAWRAARALGLEHEYEYVQ